MIVNAWLCTRIPLVVALCFGALLAPACGHADLVYREPAGGQLALKGGRDSAMKQAHRDMSAHCGAAGYRITREENVVLGTNKSTVAQLGVGPGGFGGQYVSSESVEQETRITYACGDAAVLTMR